MLYMDAAAAADANAVAAAVFVTSAITYAVCGSPVVRAGTAAAATAAGAQVPPAADGAVFIVPPPVEGGALPHREKILPLDSVRS